MASKCFQVRGPKWEGVICLLRKPEKKCWSDVYLTCCLGFKQSVSHTLAIQKLIWNEMGVCRTVPSGAKCHADTSHCQIGPFQLAASSTVYELWRSYAFFSLRLFFLVSCSSSPEKVSAGLAYLHPPFQVWKSGIHLQSLSVIRLCTKLKCQFMHKVCWLLFRAVRCPDSLLGNPY